jgi:hypothetical protein
MSSELPGVSIWIPEATPVSSDNSPILRSETPVIEKNCRKRSCHFSRIRLSYRPWSEGLLPSTEARAGRPGRHERAFRSSLAPRSKQCKGIP